MFGKSASKNESYETATDSKSAIPQLYHNPLAIAHTGRLE